MNTDFDKKPGQRRRFLLVSGVAVAVCLFVVALRERRRRPSAAPVRPLDRAVRFTEPTRDAAAPAGAAPEAAQPWAPAGHVGDPVWETYPESQPDAWPAEPVTHEPEAELYDVEGEAEVEVESAPIPDEAPRAEVEVEVEVEDEGQTTAQPGAWQYPVPQQHDAWQPAEAPHAESAPHAETEEWHVQPEAAPQHDDVEREPEPEYRKHEPEFAPATPFANWFGSSAPADSPQTPSETPSAHDADAEVAPIEQAAPVADESVIELPPVADAAVPGQDPKRLPPPLLRRFMGTGATVLVLGLVLCAGVLASGATADSTSDPATVPDAVGTTAPLPGVLPDTTTTDTTSTDTTSTDTTTTDTTTTDTTTTDTTTTDTTSTDPTTTTTDTTSTSTTPVDPPPTTSTPIPPPTDTTPTDPPASDPAAVPAAPAAPDASAPPATPAVPAVDVAPPTTPVSPQPTKKPKVTPHHHRTVVAPAKATTGATPSVGTPAASGTPVASGTPASSGSAVVTAASGADAIGSILSAHSVIPAVDASLLPTPAQVSFYVKASKPLAPLPTLARIDHPVVQRFVAAGRRDKVAWTVLAAVSRLESNLGARSGPLAGRALPTAPTGDGLGALASFLRAHGAKKNPLAPTTAKKALALYFGGSTRKADRVIALAALYGALGPAGLQKGVRAETARLQRRVLADHRVHLTVAGRSDIRHGRVDPRVLVTLEYLANSFRKVGVSDLVSGGALFSRSGSVSAHLYGRAADVASLHGKIVRGHQGPGTMTEQAIRKLLLLPKSLRPRQVISLMDVDGPTGNHGSFALPDHYDRIQIDY